MAKMNLTVSYDLFQNNWYVGELYHRFFNHLKDQGHNVEYIHIRELAKKYDNFETDTSSFFSIYNLIVTNNDTNKTFAHSLYDGAPCMMDDNSGIKNFDIAAFSCCSNLTDYEYERYSKNYNVYPSFYILEYLSDLDHIEKFKDNKDRNNTCYFNGLCYGHRGRFKMMLSDNSNFIIKDKSVSSDFKEKQDYYIELNNHKFGLSLNGAASICYRDIEYFGMGTLNLREPLKVLTNEPLIEGVHYVNFVDQNLNDLLYSDNIKEFNDLINQKLNDLVVSNQYDDIINNSKKWYENNSTLDSQIKILYSFLEKSEII
jgi:hypothetical protein